MSLNELDKAFELSILRQDQKGIVSSTYRTKVKFSNGLAKIYLIPIVLFEIFVCVQSYSYYQKHLAFGILGSISLSLCVEFFYMYFSSKKGNKPQILLKYLFLGLSVFTLAYSSYLSDESLSLYKENKYSTSKTLKSEQQRLAEQLRENSERQKLLNQTMEAYLKENFLTKGTKVLKPQRIKLSNNREVLLMKMENNRKEINLLNKTDHSISIAEEIKNLSLKTFMVIILFGLVQFSICISLPEIILKIKTDK